MTKTQSERLLTGPLLTFLVLVASAVGYGWLTARPSPDLEGAVELLADGDLDGAERQRMLLRLIDLAQHAESPRQRWAGLLAAVARQDREAYAAFAAGFGSGPSPVLPVAERRWLGLGDPLLGNLLAARNDEAAGGIADLAAARTRWQQVAAQARMTGNAFAGELAAAALQRLR